MGTALYFAHLGAQHSIKYAGGFEILRESGILGRYNPGTDITDICVALP